jgi:hypothetical protein
MYLIVKCSNCGTVQYIGKDQKTRVCPRCKARLVCKDLRVFDTADSITEASQLVRSMKSPQEISQRLARLRANQQSPNSDKYKILGHLITELLAIFPNAMPKHLLVEKALELNIPLEFLEKILQTLHNEGLMLINKDSTNHNTHFILKFPSVPFSLGKLYVKKPTSASKFRKKHR